MTFGGSGGGIRAIKVVKIANVAFVTTVLRYGFEGEIGVLCKIGSKSSNFGNGKSAFFAIGRDVVVKVQRETPTPTHIGYLRRLRLPIAVYRRGSRKVSIDMIRDLGREWADCLAAFTLQKEAEAIVAGNKATEEPK